uniref:Uncharacterized protein n=1 Tax=Clytia hemisphaerica TaxID=252671 RepID=A0A7M5XDW4_9CNID
MRFAFVADRFFVCTLTGPRRSQSNGIDNQTSRTKSKAIDQLKFDCRTQLNLNRTSKFWVIFDWFDCCSTGSIVDSVQLRLSGVILTASQHLSKLSNITSRMKLLLISRRNYAMNNPGVNESTIERNRTSIERNIEYQSNTIEYQSNLKIAVIFD